MPAIFNVFSNFATMCLLDYLADGIICGGLRGHKGSFPNYKTGKLGITALANSAQLAVSEPTGSVMWCAYPEAGPD